MALPSPRKDQEYEQLLTGQYYIGLKNGKPVEISATRRNGRRGRVRASLAVRLGAALFVTGWDRDDRF
jgi:hypothetical protein